MVAAHASLPRTGGSRGCASLAGRSSALRPASDRTAARPASSDRRSRSRYRRDRLRTADAHRSATVASDRRVVRRAAPLRRTTRASIYRRLPTRSHQRQMTYQPSPAVPNEGESVTATLTADSHRHRQRLQGRRPVAGRLRPQGDRPRRARDARPDVAAQAEYRQGPAVGKGKKIARLAAHDRADRRPHRDAHRARRRRPLGQLQHLLDAGPRRGRDRRGPDRHARAPDRCQRSSPGRARRWRSTGGAPRRWPSPGPTAAAADSIVDDGGDATMLIHMGTEYELAGACRAAVPRTPIQRGVPGHPRDLLRNSIEEQQGPLHPQWVPRIIGVTEETTTGVHAPLRVRATPARCCSRRSTSTTAVTKSKFDNKYGVPPLAHRRSSTAARRRHDRRQARGRLRLRRRRQGLASSRCAARVHASSSPRSTRSARCRRRWTACRS